MPALLASLTTLDYTIKNRTNSICYNLPKVAKISSGGIISMKYAVLPTNFATV
jgi:hypothetical protein